MKHRMIALILALTVVSSAQTVTQTTPSTPQQSSTPDEKAKCPRCDKMAASDTKDAHASCADHLKHTGDGKEMAGCCSGEPEYAKSCGVGSDGKSCMKGDKDKSACCGESCGKGKTAATCCGSKDCEKGCCWGRPRKRSAVARAAGCTANT
jgi:hypothetical protein